MVTMDTGRGPAYRKTRAGLPRFRLAAHPDEEKSNHEVARLRTYDCHEAALPNIFGLSVGRLRRATKPVSGPIWSYVTLNRGLHHSYLRRGALLYS